MRHFYPPSDYDDYLCLKPPLLLWLVVIYLSRAISLPVAMAIGSVSGVGSDALALLRQLWTLEELFPSLFAALVLYAMCRRVPTASKQVRWIWAHGLLLLSVAAGTDLVLSLLTAARNWDNSEQSLPSLFIAGIDLYSLLYIVATRRVRDTFAVFPPPLDAAVK